MKGVNNEKEKDDVMRKERGGKRKRGSAEREGIIGHSKEDDVKRKDSKEEKRKRTYK